MKIADFGLARDVHNIDYYKKTTNVSEELPRMRSLLPTKQLVISGTNSFVLAFSMHASFCVYNSVAHMNMELVDIKFCCIVGASSAF